MSKPLIEFIIIFLIAITIISQILVPVFVPGLELFWLFKKSKNKVTTPMPGSLNELNDEVVTKTTAYKDVKSKVEETEDHLKNIKSKLK